MCLSFLLPPSLPSTLHGKNTFRVRIKNKNSVIASKYGLPWDTRGCCLPPILDLGTLKKLVTHKTAWRDSAGPGGIFSQNLPSLGRRLHQLCDTCAVSPHALGVLTCFGECRVAVLMAHPGPPQCLLSVQLQRAPCRNKHEQGYVVKSEVATEFASPTRADAETRCPFWA